MASSTRKRARSSLESIKTMQSAVVTSERKTKSKRQKENYNEISSDIINKKHYVLYPGDDDGNDQEIEVKSTRVLRRHTLKEQNVNTTNPISSESAEKKAKNTRKSKKMVEDSVTNINDIVALETEVKPKVKKNKKKKQTIVHDILEGNDEIIKETVSNTKKKSKKKKNAKRLSSDRIEENAKNSVLNASMDSFYSAAGSPSNKKFNGLGMKNSEAEFETHNPTEILQASNKKLTPKLPIKYGSNLVNNNNEESDNSSKVIFDLKLNDTHNKMNDRFENTDNYYESCKDTLNSTYEKPNITNSIPVVDNIKEEILISGSKSKFSISSNSLNGFSSKCSLDKTFEKNSEHLPNNIKSLDLTIEKVNKADLTFDKDQRTSNETSNTINVTFDKSNGSLVSISSNDSRIDNLASPILIDSSLNISNVLNTPKKQEMTEKEMPIISLKREGTYIKENTDETQDLKQSEINTLECSDHKMSLDRTPKRRKSLPSPGCTPFIGGSDKSKILNLTHSIEKPARRTSLFEQSTKTTKVMFCSPISNPIVASQVKRKVIKSSLKGSNKSFLFNNTSSETKRPGTRKRSFTQNDADDTQTKRVRLVDEQQQSIDRLARPRTVSAAAKLSEPLTPSKKTATPVKTKPEAKSTRTKLPNFAALHQKRFEKMESLDECQERKAKRARQLLTPTSSLNLLERISPKGVILITLMYEPLSQELSLQGGQALYSPQKIVDSISTESEVKDNIEKVPDSPKAAPKDTRKPDTPYRPKLFTLGSLNPGYTRFGFKLNCAVNPFTAPDKQAGDRKRKTESGLTRQTTQPSLAGATAVKRLAAAKQSVMRETSFTGKRDTKRNEYRTVIKGVRTNRRFDLQMQMRNIN